MLTIGQLATYVGVSTKAIRVYHAKGLLPEPERDSAGYRRYGAQAVIDATRIATLAQAGVPLGRIPGVLNADAEGATEQIDLIDADLRAHIRQLKARRARLRDLDRPDLLCLPPAAVAYMDRVREIGLSQSHVDAIRDGWILGFALAPDLAEAILPTRTTLLEDAEYVAVLRGYDAAIDWAPDDPRLDDIATAATQLARRMTMVSDLPNFQRVSPETIDILSGHLGIDSPAWRRIDLLVAQRLRAGSSGPTWGDGP